MYSDRQLVTAFLEATSTMSLRERERATGISHSTFRRLGGKWSFLQGETRAAILRYLKRTGKMPAAVGPLDDAARARLIELMDEMQRILRGGT
jgi:hypothetical protein